MTPFGLRLRELRAQRNISQKQMADNIGVSAAYLSALEHGHRGSPSFDFVQRVITYFNIIWDDADELIALAGLSHPRVVIDTSSLSPQATEFANQLARHIGRLGKDEITTMLQILEHRNAGK